MNILIIDAQGGGIGRALVAAVRKELPEAQVTAVGTNSAATSAMLKAGAQHAAPGENAVRVCCRTADIILGPIGMVIADSLLGEITPAMTLSISRSRAKRILIPVNHCENVVAGVCDLSTGALVESAMRELHRLLP